MSLLPGSLQLRITCLLPAVALKPVGLAGVAVSSSLRTICPLPVRLPVAPPSRPVAVRIGGVPVEEDGIETVTVSSVVSTSWEALSNTVATVALPLVLPVKVTVPPLRATPVGLPERDRVKSVPTAPPLNPSGTPRLSPARRGRPRVNTTLAVSVLLPSVAVVSGVVRVTVVASLSFTFTVAEPVLLLTVYPVPLATVTVTSPLGSSVVSLAPPMVGTVKSAVVCPAWMVTLLPLPWFVELTKSALVASATVRLTGRLAVGAGLAVTVNTASLPSVTGVLAVFGAMLTMMSLTATSKLLAVEWGSAPPPTLVPRLV